MIIDSEKAIRGLECCTNSDMSMCLYNCPYHTDGCSGGIKMMRDALTLLKAQEPRVMKLEELDAIYQKETAHFWPFDTPPYMFMTVNPNVRLVSGFWICWRDIMYSLENSSPFYVRENYGKEWIIWTKKPTVAQREAVKWP